MKIMTFFDILITIISNILQGAYNTNGLQAIVLKLLDVMIG